MARCGLWTGRDKWETVRCENFSCFFLSFFSKAGLNFGCYDLRDGCWSALSLAVLFVFGCFYFVHNLFFSFLAHSKLHIYLLYLFSSYLHLYFRSYHATIPLLTLPASYTNNTIIFIKIHFKATDYEHLTNPTHRSNQ